MHPDQKVGLALAVLLVGIGGALFFRNETLPPRPTQKLRTAELLDREISARRASPYMHDSGAKKQAKISTHSGMKSDRPLTSVAAGDLPKLLDLPSTQTADIEHDDLPQHSTKPAPIVPAFQEPEPKIEVAESKPVEPMKTSKTVPSPEGSFRTHTVQRGESLSSIARRHLGSANRFEEIFEINRDQLRDPNDLRPGMALRIPTQLGWRETTPKDDIDPFRDR